MATNGEITKGISTLYDTINRIIEEARAAVYRTANITMVRAYWHIGRVIVEEEQKTELIEIIKFDPEADMFCVYSSNPDALKSFIIAFKETCENETLIQDLFLRAELD